LFHASATDKLGLSYLVISQISPIAILRNVAAFTQPALSLS